MGRLLLVFLPLWLQISLFSVRVTVDSAYVRIAPTLEAEIVGSVFADQSLEVVGRNVDGTWFQIEQPEGWISRSVIAVGFDPALLPITDLTTGLVGTTPVVDTGISVQTIDDAPLYSQPDRFSTLLQALAPFTILPVSSRTPDNQWLHVNYRGVEGWLPQYLTSTSLALNEIPIDEAFADDARFPAVVIVPVEVQRAQVDRLAAYLDTYSVTAIGIADYWSDIRTGVTLECSPVALDVPYYAITTQDISELPELRQMDSLLRRAADDLNQAIDLTRECGILWGINLGGAYADALNAHTIYRLIGERLATIRTRVG